MHLNIIPEKKTGRRFITFVETYKGEDKKQHSRTVRKIGYIDELEKEFDDPIAHFKKVAKEETRKQTEKEKDRIVHMDIDKDGVMFFNEEGEHDIRMHYGDVVIAWVIHQLKLDYFVDVRRKNLKDDYNLTNLMRLFIYERILNPTSKLENWKDRDKYYEKMDFTQSQIYAGLQRFGSYKEAILVHLDKKMKELYGRESGYAFFDGTNVYYEIEDVDALRNRGCSKENRPLPITQLGVMLDSNGFPMSYDVWSGNTNDVKMLPPAMDRARGRFNMEHMIYVADKGFYSGDTIAKAIINHDGYVIANSIRGTKIDEETRKKVLDRSNYICISSSGKVQKAFNSETEFMYKTIDTVGRRNVTDKDGKKKAVQSNKFMIAFWSRKYAERAKIDRMETILKALEKSHSNSKSKIDNTYGANRFLVTEVSDSDGNIIEDYDAKVKFSQMALDKVEELDGFYLIESNLAGLGWYEDDIPFKEGESCRWRSDWGMLQLNKTLSALNIVDIYRGLWKIENSFRIMKSFLKMRPVYVWTRQSIEGHFLICFLALLILRILEKECDYKYTTNKIKRALENATLAEGECGKYITLYSSEVLSCLFSKMNLGTIQKAYTQQDLQKLFAKTRK